MQKILTGIAVNSKDGSQNYDRIQKLCRIFNIWTISFIGLSLNAILEFTKG